MQINTFSIVAYDSITQSWGVAVASKFLAVGALVPYARAGVGAVATQSLANLSFGEGGLALMSDGLTADEALEKLIAADDQSDHRQVGLVDSKGGAATFTGKACSDWAGGITGAGYAIQGNILAGSNVIEDMAAAFEKTEGELAERLYAALHAGDDAGGDRRGKQSASLLVVKANGSYGGFTDRYLDLRVDDHANPIAELGKLIQLHHLFFGHTDAADKVTIDASLVQKLQEILTKHGYYSGMIDGNWDQSTQHAFTHFVNTENLEERVNVAEGLIDPPALDYILKHFA